MKSVLIAMWTVILILGFFLILIEIQLGMALLLMGAVVTVMTSDKLNK